VSQWLLTYGLARVQRDLLVGAMPGDRSDVEMLGRFGVRKVLNLVEDDEYEPADSRQQVAAALADAEIEERRVSVVDYGHLSPEAIEEAVTTVVDWLEHGQRTYLHCRAGWQRSATVAAGVIALTEQLEIDQALAELNERKPSADPLPHQREDLHAWWDGRSANAKQA
jgi:protein-tyrosine phosphatase